MISERCVDESLALARYVTVPCRLWCFVEALVVHGAGIVSFGSWCLVECPLHFDAYFHLFGLAHVLVGEPFRAFPPLGRGRGRCRDDYNTIKAP